MFYSVTKNANFMLLELEGATGPDEAKYQMAPNLGKVFHLPEFQAKLFKRVLVGGS